MSGIVLQHFGGADAERVARLFNERYLAGSDYWTGNHYRGQTNALWALGLREGAKPVETAAVVRRIAIATAYLVAD